MNSEHETNKWAKNEVKTFMEVAKHTPGPWECHSGMVWKGEIPIARMDREPENGTQPTERDANARLIASAPDLLEACKAFLRAPSDGSPGMGYSTRVITDFNLKAAQAAIAKATANCRMSTLRRNHAAHRILPPPESTAIMSRAVSHHANRHAPVQTPTAGASLSFALLTRTADKSTARRSQVTLIELNHSLSTTCLLDPRCRRGTAKCPIPHQRRR